jgi:hypothetical protein
VGESAECSTSWAVGGPAAQCRLRQWPLPTSPVHSALRTLHSLDLRFRLRSGTWVGRPAACPPIRQAGRPGGYVRVASLRPSLRSACKAARGLTSSLCERICTRDTSARWQCVHITKSPPAVPMNTVTSAISPPLCLLDSVSPPPCFPPAVQPARHISIGTPSATRPQVWVQRQLPNPIVTGQTRSLLFRNHPTHLLGNSTIRFRTLTSTSSDRSVDWLFASHQPRLRPRVHLPWPRRCDSDPATTHQGISLWRRRLLNPERIPKSTPEDLPPTSPCRYSIRPEGRWMRQHFATNMNVEQEPLNTQRTQR